MISLAHKTLSYDTKGCVCKTAFVKFKIRNNFKQNIDGTHSKQTKIHGKNTSVWILKISRKNPETKSLKTFANVCNFQKTIP